MGYTSKVITNLRFTELTDTDLQIQTDKLVMANLPGIVVVDKQGKKVIVIV